MLETSEPPAAPADDRPLHRVAARFRRLDAMQRASLAVDVVVLAAAAVFVLAQLGPSLLVADTTPAGGDMGAHVWGPAYLRDNLLPSGRLAGWAPDWYAGFPAYHFYMVVPALLIVALDAGWDGWAALVPLAVGLGLLAVAAVHRRPPVPRAVLAIAGALVILLGCGLPYGVAFKWVTVLGVVLLPLACYVAARLADLPFPGPPLAAVAAVVFLFNREPTTNGTGNIIGGNMTSTLAGEFSFSLSLLCAVLYLGFLLRGLRTGGHRAVCAVLLGLTALNHVIPAIFAAGATVVAVVVSMPIDRRRLRWFLPIGPVALAISAFWTLPFAARRAYLNDMGWEKIPSGIAEVPLRDFLWGIWREDRYDRFRTAFLDVIAPSPLRWIMALAVVGAVVSIALRIRIGVLLAICTVGTLIAFVVAPQGRLWNARLLPFYVLCMCLLAGIAVAELARAVASLLTTRAERAEARVDGVSVATPIGAALAVWIAVGLPLGALPGGTRDANGAEQWFGLEAADPSPVRDWARWNYTGYERKPAYPEYHGLVTMAERIAADPELGCGRVMWEYENERLNRYGTPMAPMLLPFWTDGCMGSMEGLYFEASSTTPYHFLNQRALSANCSCAQRDLPYGSAFDIDLGVQQLQQMGVRYYFAFTDTAVTAASNHPDLTEVAVSDDDLWHAYLVEDSDLVEPLTHRPAVVTGLEPGMSWVGVASKWWQDPERWDVVLADDGPDDWERVASCTAPEPDKPPGEPAAAERPTWTRIDACTAPAEVVLPEVTVSNVEVGRDGISFDVSEPGVPVLVKMSYFPNWEATGAEGPFRVTPNHMVVVPTETHVELRYGWTGLDLGSYALSGAGIVGAVVLARRPMRRDDDGGDLWLDGPDPVVAVPAVEPPVEEPEDTEP